MNSISMASSRTSRRNRVTWLAPALFLTVGSVAAVAAEELLPHGQMFVEFTPAEPVWREDIEVRLWGDWPNGCRPRRAGWYGAEDYIHVEMSTSLYSTSCGGGCVSAFTPWEVTFTIDYDLPPGNYTMNFSLDCPNASEVIAETVLTVAPPAGSDDCSLVVDEDFGTRIYFFSAAGAGPERFDVIGGDLHQVLQNANFASAECIRQGASHDSADTLGVLLPGEARYFLARGHDQCAQQGYGDGESGPGPRQRLDATNPCDD